MPFLSSSSFGFRYHYWTYISSGGIYKIYNDVALRTRQKLSGLEKVKFVLATKNKGKLIEFRRMLDLPEVELLGMEEIPQLKNVEIREDGKTFLENALKKAKEVSRRSGMPAIADDSGLVVYALGGRPGVYSARFAGESATDEQNNLKLLQEMRCKTNRKAAFVCVLAVVSPKGRTFIYEGRCEGLITEAPLGNKGFGYDPVFYYPPLKKTFAQMDVEEKNKVSHRAMAIKKLKHDIQNILSAFKEEGCL
jgi:XTP/dITP diphosphohydrolase